MADLGTVAPHVHDRIGGNFSFGSLGDLDFFTVVDCLLEPDFGLELGLETPTADDFLKRGIEFKRLCWIYY